MSKKIQENVKIVIESLQSATHSSAELDSLISALFYRNVENFTSEFKSAMSLLPKSVLNFNLFNFIGHGRKDIKRFAWGCHCHDASQLVGAERAKTQIKRLNVNYFGPNSTTSISLEKAIAEQFCDFGSTHCATPEIAISLMAVKVLAGISVDDDLWLEV